MHYVSISVLLAKAYVADEYSSNYCLSHIIEFYDRGKIPHLVFEVAFVAFNTEK